VRRWAKKNLISCVRMPSGQRRYYADEIEELLAGTRAWPRPEAD
jgi:predicted site-specific integrase-resolvase